MMKNVIMKQNYERLTIEKFGKLLLKTNDLDPVYVALRRTNMGASQLKRWLIAYLCFYNAGSASWLSEYDGLEFWDWMGIAALNVESAPTGGRWPRAKERRHFRGDVCVRAVQQLREWYGRQPEDMITEMVSCAPNYEEVADRVKKHPLFGPWVAFKIADMLETVLDVRVDFSQAAVFMFKDPTKAALMQWRLAEGHEPESDVQPPNQQQAIEHIVGQLQSYFGLSDAPPTYQRKVNLQEIETILCKWKSHYRGHYPVGNDVYEIRAGVDPWIMYSDTARAFLDSMPQPHPEMQVEE